MASNGGEAAERIRAIRLSTFGAPAPAQVVDPVQPGEGVALVEPVEKETVSVSSPARMAYEMEAAAHRETIDKLLAEKERLIEVLMGRVGDLENRLEAVESALQMERLADEHGS